MKTASKIKNPVKIIPKKMKVNAAVVTIERIGMAFQLIWRSAASLMHNDFFF